MKVKVVRRIGRRTEFGSVSLPTSHPGAVKYRRGEWSSAPQHCQERGYHLLVFDDLLLAKRFTEDQFPGGTTVMFYCETQGIIKELPLMQGIFNYPFPGFHDMNNYFCWPKGTVMVKKVKLIREVE